MSLYTVFQDFQKRIRSLKRTKKSFLVTINPVSILSSVYNVWKESFQNIYIKESVIPLYFFHDIIILSIPLLSENEIDIIFSHENRKRSLLLYQCLNNFFTTRIELQSCKNNKVMIVSPLSYSRGMITAGCLYPGERGSFIKYSRTSPGELLSPI